MHLNHKTVRNLSGACSVSHETALQTESCVTQSCELEVWEANVVRVA